MLKFSSPAMNQPPYAGNTKVQSRFLSKPYYLFLVKGQTEDIFI